MQFTLLAFLASAALTTAHFTLDYPYTTGYYYLQEVNAPCGGFPPDLSNLTAYPLEGGEVAFDLHHPYALFLIRAQLVGMNTWVNLSNGFILQNGLGEGCVNAGPVPGNWSGQAGVIQVVGQPPDDILYQCAGVLFTPGAPGTSSVCVNGSGVTINDTTESFPVSNLSVVFAGTLTSTNVTTTNSAGGAAATSAPPSPSASSKSGAETIHVHLGIVFLTGVIMVAASFLM